MPSPFPGMNPYLEQNDTWEEFHNKCISSIQDALVTEVGPNYIVKMETRIYVRELPAKERWLRGKADVGISRSSASGENRSATDVAAPSAPLGLSLPNVDVERHTSLEIQDVRTRRFVTVIELLSPTNKKEGPDRDDYINKRSLMVNGLVNWVEIDLRRGGTRPHAPELPACDYYVLVCKKSDWPQVGVWPLSLRDRLPVVPIPLSPPDASVTLDLQAVLHRVYDAADYGKYIYYESPEPPLSPEDAEWAKQFIIAK